MAPPRPLVVAAVVLVVLALVGIAVNLALGGTIGTKRGRLGRRVLDIRPPSTLPAGGTLPAGSPAPAPATQPVVVGTATAAVSLVGTGSTVDPYVTPSGGIGAPL